MRGQRAKAGFSLVEVIAAMFVISVGMPAIAYMYTTAMVIDSDSTSKTQAIYLANSLLNEISMRRYKESALAPGNGPDAGEVTAGSYSRTLFDDIDDYQQFSKTGGWGLLNPPRDEQGNSLTDFPQYSQTVSVINLAPPSVTGVLNLTAVGDGTTDIKLVSVVASWLGGRQSVTVKKIFTIP